MTIRVWKRALSLLVALCAPAFLATCSRPPPRPNVLVITIDTWRADRLSCAGFPRVVTPNLDRLASEGLRFTHVSVPRAKTTPAIASLFTGLYPHEHGARDLLMPLASTHPLLTERLRDAGWRTGAIVGNFVLRDDFSGLARGFDSWTEDLPDALGVPPENVPQRAARSLTDGALAALGLEPHAGGAGPKEAFTRPDAPWFLWLHYMDPHGIYAAPLEHRVYQRAEPEWIPPAPALRPDGLNRRWIAEYNVPADARAPDGRIDAARVRDHYDAEVRYADAEIGRVLDALRASGELERTIVVVTSDHGESLGEQDYWFEHGRNVSEATVRIPLLVRWPKEIPGGFATGVRDVDTSLCDVAPTLLDLLGLPPLAEANGARGISLARVWRDGAGLQRPIFAEKVDRDEEEGAIQSKSVRIGDWKWIRRFTHARAASSGTGTGTARLVTLSDELYDLAADPDEATNLAANPPSRAPVDRLVAELVRFTALDERFPELGAILREHRGALEGGDAETIRILKALGY